MSIGVNLKIARLRKGYGLRVLAQKLGHISHTMIANYENNDPVPNSATLAKLAELLDVSPFYLERNYQYYDLPVFFKRSKCSTLLAKAIVNEYLNAIRILYGDLPRRTKETEPLDARLLLAIVNYANLVDFCHPPTELTKQIFEVINQGYILIPNPNIPKGWLELDGSLNNLPNVLVINPLNNLDIPWLITPELIEKRREAGEISRELAESIKRYCL